MEMLVSSDGQCLHLMYGGAGGSSSTGGGGGGGDGERRAEPWCCRAPACLSQKSSDQWGRDGQQKREAPDNSIAHG